jgi:tRNA G26 N,N-dimethylase Trm1
MRLWRFEAGRWKSDSPAKWELELDCAMCGCKIITAGPFYFTFLGDECYYHIMAREAEARFKKILRRKNRMLK